MSQERNPMLHNNGYQTCGLTTGQPANHGQDRSGPVLTPEQWDIMYGEAYREMGEEQAKTRNARRARAVSRPRGRTGKSTNIMQRIACNLALHKWGYTVDPDWYQCLECGTARSVRR